MVNIVNDRIGFFEDVSAALGYAYQMDLGAGRLGLGLAVDFKNKNVRNAQWIYPDNPSDPAVVGTGATSFTPELNFGAYYTTDTWLLGSQLHAYFKVMLRSLAAVRALKAPCTTS